MTMSIVTSLPYTFIPVFNVVAPQFLPYPWVFTQTPDELCVLQGRQPQAVSKAWNDGIAQAIAGDCEYTLVLNDDVVLKHNAIDRLVTFAMDHHEAALWSMGDYHDLSTIQEAPEDEKYSEHPNFSAFLIHRGFTQVFGQFDENFQPAYFEDGDCHARLTRLGQKAYVYGGARFFHFGSRTINVDPEFRDEMPAMFEKNAAYFASKWGCLPLVEVAEQQESYFSTPFNDPERGINDW